jgi:hypothetical protein
MAVGNWEIAPSEFWLMCPVEFWLVYAAKKPPKMYGRLSEDEVERLTDFLDEEQEKWQAQQQSAA